MNLYLKNMWGSQVVVCECGTQINIIPIQIQANVSNIKPSINHTAIEQKLIFYEESVKYRGSCLVSTLYTHTHPNARATVFSMYPCI